MRKVVFIIGLLTSSMMVSSQVINRDICREMAIANNNRLKIAYDEQQRAEFGIKEYRAKFLPAISASAFYMATNSTQSLNFRGGTISLPEGSTLPNLPSGTAGAPGYGLSILVPDINVEFGLSNAYNLGVMFKQPIYMGGKIFAAHSIALQFNDIAKENIELTKSDVILKADQAYWSYIKASEMVVVANEYLKTINELLRSVRNSNELGLALKSDLLRVETELNEAKLMVRKAENGRNLARMNLCYATGLELASEIVVSDSLDFNIEVPKFEGVNVTERAEYKMLEKKSAIIKNNIKITLSDYLPSLALVGGYNYSGGLIVNDKLAGQVNGFSAMATLSIPIFSWGEGRNRVKSAKSELKSAKHNLDDMHLLMELEATKYYQEYQEAYYRIQLTTSSLISADENIKVSKNSYEAGLMSLVELLESQSLWHMAHANNIDAKLMYQLSHTQYIKAIGQLNQ